MSEPTHPDQDPQRLTNAEKVEARAVMETERRRVESLSRKRVVSLKGGATEAELAAWKREHPYPGNPDDAAFDALMEWVADRHADLTARLAQVEAALAIESSSYLNACAERDAALALLAEGIAAETEPCRLDHNGDCQEHGWFDGECWVPRVRVALASRPDTAPQPDDEDDPPIDWSEPETWPNEAIRVLNHATERAFASGERHQAETRVQVEKEAAADQALEALSCARCGALYDMDAPEWCETPTNHRAPQPDAGQGERGEATVTVAQPTGARHQGVVWGISHPGSGPIGCIYCIHTLQQPLPADQQEAPGEVTGGE